jgi:hypothetical protein
MRNLSFYKKLLLIFIILCSNLFSAKSQVIYNENSNSPQTLSLNSYHFTEKRYEAKILGSNYISDEWQLSDILTTIDSIPINNVLIKIDVFNNVIEIKDADIIKILPANQTKYFKLKDKNEYFITTNVLGDFILNGFSKVIFNGKITLLTNYSAKVKEAKYNEALAVGNRDDELIIVKSYYFFMNNNLLKTETTKKRLMKQFADNPKIQLFIKENKISPKDEKDLIYLVKFIDSTL